MSRRRLLVGLLAGVALAVGLGVLRRGAGAGDGPWSPATLEVAARLPAQVGGRVLPLGTWADVFLLQLNHRKGGADAAGRALDPVEVVLDVLTRPDVAADYPVFVVDDAAVLEAVGVAPASGKRRRDRWTFRELGPAAPEVLARAAALDDVPRRRRSEVEEGIVALRDALVRYRDLAVYLDFGRRALDPASAPGLGALFPGRAAVGVPDLLREVAALTARAAGEGEEAGAARALLDALARRGALSTALATIAPPAPAADAPAWWTPGDVIRTSLETGRPPAPEVLAALEAWSGVAAAAGDRAAADRAVDHLAATLHGLAVPRGEGEQLGLEAALRDLDPFRRATWGYLVGFLLVAATWAWRSRALARGALAVVVATLLLHVAGIVVRCVLRGRPPMSTLYETTLFVSAFAVAASLAVERLVGRGLGLALAPLLGAVGLFVSNRYEELTAADTMPVLEAVLDTNFWLATHVTCIGIGYAATLVASAFAHVHVLGRVLAPRRMTGDAERAVVRATYGVLAFALVFSVVGTILGGVWANESWGRFWGWDPKENGALLICLVQLATLHGRVGGLWRGLGVSLLTVLGGCVVGFSWWGVNLLEIGLHSYGFTRGVWTGLLVFWGVEAAVLAVGVVALLRARSAPTSPPPLR